MNRQNMDLLRQILSKSNAAKQNPPQTQGAIPAVAAGQGATPIAQTTAGNGSGAGATISALPIGAGQTGASVAPQPMPQTPQMGTQGMGARAMLQQLLGNAGIDFGGMGKRAMLKAYAGQNQITDPNGGRFRNREMLQGILAKYNQPVAGQPVVGGPAQPAPAPAPTQGIAPGEPAPGGTGQQASTGQAMPGAQQATGTVSPLNQVHNRSYQAPIRQTSYTV